MSVPSTMNPASAGPAKLVILTDSDLVELAQFIAAQSKQDSTRVEKRLRWFLLENPARDAQFPLGCGLRSPQGKLVGCILYVPQFFRFQQQKLLVIGSSSFYVDERYRGSGALIFLRFTELAKKWPLFGNSANSDAARLWKARGAVPIPYSDHELFGVLRWKGVIHEALHRRGVPEAIVPAASALSTPFANLFRRLKLKSGGPEKLRPLASSAEAVQLLIHDAPSQLTADRDLQYLTWRYFSGHDPTIAVYAFRNTPVEAEILVTVNQRSRGFREQIRTLNILDIYPAVAPEKSAEIAAALVERYRGTVDAIVLRGMNSGTQDDSDQSLFRHLGFIGRNFEAPNGWFLDKKGFLPSQTWYTVPADGDLLI